MKKQEYKSFAELYTNIIKEVSDEVGEPFSVVIKQLNGREKLIRDEYEQMRIGKHLVLNKPQFSK